PDISPLPVNMAFVAAIDAFLLVGFGSLAIIKSFGEFADVSAAGALARQFSVVQFGTTGIGFYCGWGTACADAGRDRKPIGSESCRFFWIQAAFYFWVCSLVRRSKPDIHGSDTLLGGQSDRSFV